MSGEYPMLIRVQELEEMANDVSMPADVRRICIALTAAMNDWPTPNLDSLEAFVAELRKFIGELSKARLCQKLDGYSPPTDAWKCESFSELFSVWDTADEAVFLDDMIKRVIRHSPQGRLRP